MAVSVKMSSKNQIVVPREARDALDLRPGDRLVVSVRDDGVLEMKPQPRDVGAELEGVLGATVPGVAGGESLWVELAHE